MTQNSNRSHRIGPVGTLEVHAESAIHESTRSGAPARRLVCPCIADVSRACTWMNYRITVYMQIDDGDLRHCEIGEPHNQNKNFAEFYAKL
jgi:hypothetical protein